MTTTLQADDIAAVPSSTTPRGLGWLLTIGGGIGLAAAVVLTLDKIKIYKDPDFKPNCDIGSVLSCSNIMKSNEAEAFGFPNSLLGLVGFAVVITIGVLVISRVELPEWIWGGMQLGTLFGVSFVHWLFFQAVYDIGFLCPYCMVVWAVTIPIFFYVTLRNLRTWLPGNPVVEFLCDWHALILALWIVAIATAIFIRFWDSIFI